jgi:copper chaperone CopZ
MGIPKRNSKDTTTTTRFTVEGMTCSGCVDRVETTIRSLPGIVSVAIDLADSLATIDYDVSKTTRDQIREAIISAGYKIGERT